MNCSDCDILCPKCGALSTPMHNCITQDIIDEKIMARRKRIDKMVKKLKYIKKHIKEY